MDQNIVVAAATDTTPARALQLLACLVVVAGTPVREILVYPDGMEPATVARVGREVALLRATTGLGCPKRVEWWPLSRWSTEVLRRLVYRAKRPLVGAHLPFVCTRVAEHVTVARDPFWRGGWTLGLPGWGQYRDMGRARGRMEREWRPSRHCPYLRVRADGRGSFIGFGNCGGRRRPDGTVETFGTIERGPHGEIRSYSGRFHDVVRAAYALGAPHGDLGDALDAFGIPWPVPVYDPGAVDGRMIAAARAEVMATHLLHGRLLEEVDEHAGISLDLGRLQSPAGVAVAYRAALEGSR